MMRRVIFIGLLILIGIGTVSGSGGWLNPTMTSSTAPYGVVTCSTQHASFPAWRSFDHVTTNYGWTAVSGTTTGWLQYKFQSGVGIDAKAVIDEYRVTVGAERARDPKSWTFLASNTGAFAGEEVTLDTQSAQSFSTNYETKTYTFTNANGYYYYRWNISENNGDPTYLQTAELALYGAFDEGPINATFTANKTSGKAPMTVQFNDTSRGLPTSWAWNFTEIGNNTPCTFSNVRNASYTFSKGNYSIQLNATSLISTNQSVQKTWINVTTSLNASFTGTPTTGAIPMVVYFNDTSTGTPPDSWLWDFGDGNTTDNTLQNTSHVYTTEGTYSVNLTVTNTEGTEFLYQPSYIVAYAPLTAGFSTFNNAGTAPFTTYLYDTSTNLTPGPATYYWMLGDGNTSTAQNLYFTWNKTGTYSVNHSVNNGLSTSWKNESAYITVGTPTPAVVAPVASFYGGPQIGGTPLVVYFTDASANTPTSWNWSFGDSTFGITQNPSHTYNSSGFFTVNLTATNSAGSNVTSQTNFIMVY